jgi:opacity protein-like surface antigen
VRRWAFILGMISAYALDAYADHSVLLLAKGSFTTNTRIFYDSNDPQAYAGITNVSLNYGIGAELRVRTFWERWVLGIAVEKISGSVETSAYYLYPAGSLMVPRKDGYEMVPIEISAYYTVPISSNSFDFYLGGGFGYYTGKRNYSVASTASRSTDMNSALGLQVSTGVRWLFTPFLAVDMHLRFRDPQINAVNIFDQKSTSVRGVPVPLAQGPMYTQINLNGINYSAGLAIVF